MLACAIVLSSLEITFVIVVTFKIFDLDHNNSVNTTDLFQLIQAGIHHFIPNDITTLHAALTRGEETEKVPEKPKALHMFQKVNATREKEQISENKHLPQLHFHNGQLLKIPQWMAALQCHAEQPLSASFERFEKKHPKFNNF